MKNKSGLFQVVVADDHPLVTIAIEKILKDDGRFIICGTADSGSTLLDLLERRTCHLLITDFLMPTTELEARTNIDGVRLLGLIRRRHPNLNILVSTMITNGGMLQDMIDTGVRAVVSKQEPREVFVDVCLLAARESKGIFLSPRILAQLDSNQSTTMHLVPRRCLSPKEHEVIRLYVQGNSLTSIAHQLNRALSTVATQKRSAMRKLNIFSNADLIKYAASTGIN